MRPGASSGSASSPGSRSRRCSTTAMCMSSGISSTRRIPSWRRSSPRQRAYRVERARAMAQRLADLGKPIDVGRAAAAACRSSGLVGRPAGDCAGTGRGRACEHGGHRLRAADRRGLPAWVPRNGATPAEVIHTIARAGGVASLAHPGLTRHDELIAEWVEAGLPALEVYHSEHSAADVVRYRAMARAMRAGRERRLRLSRRRAQRPIDARHRDVCPSRIRGARSPSPHA